MIIDLVMEDLKIPEQSESKDSVRVIMFYGKGCGPCTATMPHYEQSIEFYESKNANIKFYRINAWEPEEQKKFCTDIMGITGVPHFKAFCRGEMILEKVGGGDTITMKKFIHEVIDEAFKRFGAII